MTPDFLGWCVSTAASNGSRLLTRPFNVGTFHREDAERYAYDEVAKDYPPDEG